MSISFRLSSIVLAVTLAGCAAPVNPLAQQQQRLNAEQQSLNQAMALRVLSQPLPLDIAFRFGTNLAIILINVPAQGAEAATRARIFATCDSSTLKIDYQNKNDWIRPFTPADTQLKNAAIAQRLCQAARGTGDKQLPGDTEDVVFLDPGSLSVDNARRSIWVGVDYRRTRLSDEQGYPYDSQIERIEIDCKTRQINTRLAYRLSDGGLIPPFEQSLPSTLDKAQRARLSDAVCATPTGLTQLAAMARRVKLPPNMATPPIPATLLQQASQLPYRQPANTLSHVHLTFRAISPLMPSAAVTDAPIDLYLEPGPAPGIWRIQNVGGVGDDGVNISWRGLIDLATTQQDGVFSKLTHQSVVTSVGIRGDWQNLVPGSAIGYSKTFTGDTGKSVTHNYDCSVGKSMPAAQLVASLQGGARLITCAEVGILKVKQAYLYLEDYDLFVQILDASELLIKVNTLKSAE